MANRADDLFDQQGLHRTPTQQPWQWGCQFGTDLHECPLLPTHIGRFLSADTLVPDATNPQAHNRYSYTFNNPINLNDPTGHCGADPAGSTNIEGIAVTQLCTELRDFLQSLYDISIQGIWTYHEMELFEMAIRDMVFGFGGDNNFRLLFSRTNVVRYRENGGSEVSLPLDEVQIRNSQFHKGDDFARWVFIHEFGHRLDIITALTASIALEVYTGSETTGLGCGLPGVDLLGYCGWDPAGDTVSSYAFRTNRREDWSEAFAASMFRGNWTKLVSDNTHGIRDDALTVAVNRIDFIREQIPLLLNSIDAAPTWSEP